MSGRGRVRVAIDRLVVDGVPRASGQRFAEETVAELRRLAATGAPPAPYPERGLTVDPARDPVGAAREVAAVIHTRLIESGHG